MIEFSLSAGSKALMLTAGDSHYLCFSDAEMEPLRDFCRRKNLL